MRCCWRATRGERRREPRRWARLALQLLLYRRAPSTREDANATGSKTVCVPPALRRGRRWGGGFFFLGGGGTHTGNAEPVGRGAREALCRDRGGGRHLTATTMWTNTVEGLVLERSADSRAASYCVTTASLWVSARS